MKGNSTWSFEDDNNGHGMFINHQSVKENYVFVVVYKLHTPRFPRNFISHDLNIHLEKIDPRVNKSYIEVYASVSSIIDNLFLKQIT